MNTNSNTPWMTFSGVFFLLQIDIPYKQVSKRLKQTEATIHYSSWIDSSSSSGLDSNISFIQ